MQSSPFTTAADARQFSMAGNATITLRSKKTDQRFTYRIQAPHFEGNEGTTATRNVAEPMRFVQFLRGSDNTSDYAYLGYIRRGVFFHGGAKAKAGHDAPCAKAFAWAWQKIQQDQMPDSLEVWHEGRCGRCNRKLTVPSSIASGIGPDCAEQMGLGSIGDFFTEAI